MEGRPRWPKGFPEGPPTQEGDSEVQALLEIVTTQTVKKSNMPQNQKAASSDDDIGDR